MVESFELDRLDGDGVVGCQPKNRGIDFTPKMDGENNGKAY